jgi:N-acetylneuraminic acid mutarotase
MPYVPAVNYWAIISCPWRDRENTNSIEYSQNVTLLRMGNETHQNNKARGVALKADSSGLNAFQEVGTVKTVHLCVIILILLCLPSVTSAQEDTWTAETDMPTASYGLATAVVNGRIYAIGGFGAMAMVEQYNPGANTWTEKANMPTPRVYLAASAVDGIIYAIGGSASSSGPVPLSTVEAYDPVADTWKKKADMPTPRASLATSVVDGKIYAIGGENASSSISTVEAYDPATDTWTRKADMPTARVYFTASAVNGKIYVIGGSIGDDVSISTVEEYDPATDTWTKKADMPTARDSLSSSVANGRIYAIGGWMPGGVPVATVEQYDPATDTWTKKADMPTARWDPAASAVNGMIYAMGGFQTRMLSTVEAYDTGVGIRVWEVFPQEGRVTGGELMVIRGRGFPLDVKVTIGGNPLGEMEVTDTIITGVISPGTEGGHDILITAPNIDPVMPGEFFYNPVSNVTVARITPTNGKQTGGEAGSIAGSGFLPGATVTIDGVPATDVGVTPTIITFTLPPGTEGAKDVVVTNPDGQKATLRGAYTYNPFPVIGRIRPLYGGPLNGGTEMTITGSNFMEGVSVTIGENRVQRLEFFSPTELRLRTPPGTIGPKAVSVTNPDGQEAVKEDGFTYNPAPKILSVSPNAGPLEGGTSITITGTGFIRPVDVIVGNANVTSLRSSPTGIIAETPLSDAGVKDVTVVNPDGQRDTLKDAFTYNTAPVITRVTPDNGRLAGGTRITIHGGGFQPGAEVRISINQGAYRAASSVEVMSSSIITALTPPGQPGAENVLVLNPDMQIVILPEGYTYNPIPTITRLIPNHGPSSGGATITVEGTGFLLGARVVIGEKAATTMVRDDMTIEAVAPPNPQGVWDVRVVNPDTQEVVMPGGYVSAGEVVYNYPNPFHASQGTTFRYVTKDPVLSVTVKIFNLRGRPIGAARQVGSDEVKWVDPDVYAGLYIYILEAEFEGGKRKQVRNVMEVVE